MTFLQTSASDAEHVMKAAITGTDNKYVLTNHRTIVVAELDYISDSRHTSLPTRRLSVRYARLRRDIVFG